MNGTNGGVSGSGTASDPYIYNYHATAQSHETTWLFYTLIILIGLTAIAGFGVGFYFGKRQKKPN